MSMSSRIALLSDANRGIGLEIVKQLPDNGQAAHSFEIENKSNGKLM